MKIQKALFSVALCAALFMLSGCGGGGGGVASQPPPSRSVFLVQSNSDTEEKLTFFVDGVKAEPLIFWTQLGADEAAHGGELKFQATSGGSPGAGDARVFVVTTSISKTEVPRSGRGAQKHIEVRVLVKNGGGGLSDYYTAQILRWKDGPLTKGVIVDDANTDITICASGNPADIISSWLIAASFPPETSRGIIAVINQRFLVASLDMDQ